MALTRSFKETIKARLSRDTAFRDALFGEAIDAFLQGDPETGKAVLRDLINGTVGFEKLATRIRRPSKSLHRMLGANGNPTTENFFAVMHALQRETGVRLEVRVRKTMASASGSPPGPSSDMMPTPGEGRPRHLRTSVCAGRRRR